MDTAVKIPDAVTLRKMVYERFRNSGRDYGIEHMLLYDICPIPEPYFSESDSYFPEALARYDAAPAVASVMSF